MKEDMQELDEYTERLRPYTSAIDENSGHMIVSALIAYSTGLYDRTAGKCDEVIGRLEGEELPAAFTKALEILRHDAVSLVSSQTSVRSEFTIEGKSPLEVSMDADDTVKVPSFESGDHDLLAIRLPEGNIEVEWAFDRDNAIILLYAVGIISSPYDRPQLEERMQGFVLQKFQHYRTPV